MLQSIKKYLAIINIHVMHQFMYPLNILGFFVLSLFKTIILVQLYSATAQSTLTLSQILWILVITNAAEATTFGIIGVMSYEIQSGSIAYALIRPYSYLLYQSAFAIGSTIPIILITIVGIGPLLWYVTGPVSCSWYSIGTGILLWLGAFVLNFLICFCIGTNTFWHEETGSLAMLFHSLMLLFGGALLPLALMPPLLITITHYLPYGYLFANAAQTMFVFNYNQLLHSIIGQCIWIMIALYSSQWLLKRGLKHVEAHGG
jgi:ABC-2 type transport system permease protein